MLIGQGKLVSDYISWFNNNRKPLYLVETNYYLFIAAFQGHVTPKGWHALIPTIPPATCSPRRIFVQGIVILIGVRIVCGQSFRDIWVARNPDVAHQLPSASSEGSSFYIQRCRYSLQHPLAYQQQYMLQQGIFVVDRRGYLVRHRRINMANSHS